MMETLDPGTLLREERAPSAPEPEARRPRSVSARDAFVTMVVGLTVWALLAAPTLERSAEAGPIGARRAAALAVLRPLVAISRTLLLTQATATVERALDRDPRAQPGGELVLPELDLPPATFGPEPEAETMPEVVTPEAPAARTDPTESPPVEPAEEPAAVEGMREPSWSRPLRVAVIGDSLSQGLGPAIERWMDPGLVRVLSLGRQSTGLARQDYFNWQAGMRQIVEEFRPDLVFVMLGSNDAQPQVSREGEAIPIGSVTWVRNYRERAAQLVRIATRSGTRVVWVGIPVVRERSRWTFYRRVNGIYRDVARDEPFATYVDAWSAFEARGGGYTAFLRNDHGELMEMRASDGVHFTPTGYTYLGRMAIRAAVDAFGLSPKAATFRV